MPESRSRPIALAVWLIIAGVIGWWAAFQLTLEKLHTMENPGAALGCDFSPLVQCSANLDSAQGAVFGFPNPIVGITGWVAPIVVGVAVLAGARFSKWFWALFELGMLFAFCFVVWLIAQSIFIIGTLCPWCMVTWAVTIPAFYAVTLHVLRIGAVPVPRGVRNAAGTLAGWVPLLTVLSFILVAVLAQLRLDILGTLF